MHYEEKIPPILWFNRVSTFNYDRGGAKFYRDRGLLSDYKGPRDRAVRTDLAAPTTNSQKPTSELERGRQR